MAFLFNVYWISFLMTVESLQLNEGDFTPSITCRSELRFHDIRCSWQPLEDCHNHCNLSFKSLECKDYTDWTQCLMSSADNECTFPRETFKFKQSCLRTFELKLLCNCTSTEHLLESSSIIIHRSNTVLPNPPRALRLQSVGQKAMNVSWELPDGWKYDSQFLTYMFKYWQQWPPNQKSKVTPFDGGSNENLYRVFHNMSYAFVETCFLVAVRYEDGPSISEWSWSPEPVCNRTRKEVPAAKPGNLTLTVDQASRQVNVSWKEIPVQLQGAPIQFYTVKFKMRLGNSTWENKSETQTYCILADLNRNHEYDIIVAAVNEVGLSDYATVLLPADPAAEFKPLFIVGFVLPLIVILLVLISTAIVCRRKRRSARQKLEGVKIKHHMDVVVKPGPEKESEVFDIPHRSMEESIYIKINKDVETPVQKREEEDPLLERTTTTISRTIAEEDYIRFHAVRDHVVNQVSSDYVRLPDGERS